MAPLERFTIDITDATLSDLRRRIGQTRWPDEVDGAAWDYGASLPYLRALLDYWADGFDWRSRERELNALEQYTVTIDGTTIHFVVRRSGDPGAIPLLLLHGWPSTFVQMTRIMPLLTAGEPSFDVVVPSLPGYGFSQRPTERGMNVARMAVLLSRLMTDVLGYRRYGVRGSDFGAGIASVLPRRELIGIHLSGTNPFARDFPDDLSPHEQGFVDELERWVQAEFAYARQQSTKPQTLAFGLNDSPAGLAAWLVEKYHRWSDCDGDVESRFTKDDLLTQLTIYWATETIGSSMRLYYETVRSWTGPPDPEVHVPLGVAMFPKDMVPMPRGLFERTQRVDRWADMPRGGHFGEWEEPEVLASDIRAFFAELV